MSYFIDLCIVGLSIGMIYGLIAIGIHGAIERTSALIILC